MGRSYTYNVVPYYGDGNRGIFGGAMNKREMEVLRRTNEKYGYKVIGWYAQTKTGEKMLGGFYANDAKLKRPKFVKCMCDGGVYGGIDFSGSKVNYQCPVCEGVGFAPKGRQNKWMEWQIERFKTPKYNL